MIINAEQIKEKANVYEIVADFVNLKKKGVNYLGSCPFHNEKTASFVVSPAKGIYKCFGCGEAGNGISFLMSYEKMSYPEALEYVAKKTNTPIEYSEDNSEMKKKKKFRENLITVNTAVMKFYTKHLKGEALNYLKERNFSNETIEKWQLGFAPEGYLLKNFISGNYSTESAIAAGLLNKNHKNGTVYDKLRNRITFPFIDVKGNVIGYSARDISCKNDIAKYMNSPENEVFHKSSFLYGLFQAKDLIKNDDYAIEVEGQTDVLRLHEKGLPAVGTSGTALTAGHVKLLKRFTQNVVIIRDSDTAGKAATRKDIDLFLQQNFSVYVVSLPDGEDPDSFFKETAPHFYISQNKKDWFSFLTDSAKAVQSNPSEFSEQIKALEKTISLIPDHIAIQEYSKKIETIFNIRLSAIKAKVQVKDKGFVLFEEAKAAIEEQDQVFLFHHKEEALSKFLKGFENSLYVGNDISKDDILALKELTTDVIFEDAPNWAPNHPEPKFIQNLRKLYSYDFNIKTYDDDYEDYVNVDTGEVTQNFVNFSDWYIDKKLYFTNTANNNSVAETIDSIAEILSYLNDSVRTVKISAVKEQFKKKNIPISLPDFKKILNKYLKKNAKEFGKSLNINPADSSLDLTNEQFEDLNKYSHYFKNNTIRHVVGSEHRRITNFIIKPIIHSNNSNSHFKLFEMLNDKGHKVQISLETPDLNNVNRFKNAIEAKGNFIFKGNQLQLDNIKERLYDNTIYSTEIENLGWQFEEFFAWADGITTTDGQFKSVDENGLIQFNKENYLIKPFSNLYKNDRTAFINEKKFRHKTSETSFQDWYVLYERVFGANAMISTCALMTAFYSDIIFKLVFNELPILNFFGPKGTGKTQQADSLLSFFGDKQPTNNISKLTPYGLAQTLKSFHNAFVLIDEYKNSLDMKWIELLKSIYNRQPKVQGNWSQQGTKTEAINVNSMVLLCGQDLPTLDVALLDRCICLTSYNTKFSEEQKDNYKLLKNIEQKGMAHATDEFLKYREIIISKFEDSNSKIQKLISDEASDVSGRIQKSLGTLLTPLFILRNYIEIPFSFEAAFEHGINVIKEQQKFIQNSSDLGNFWTIFETMIEQNRIKEGRNYKLQNVAELRLYELDNPVSFGASGMNVLFLRWQGLYPLYAEYSRRSNMVALQEQTLISYLKKSESFIGKIKAKKFKDNQTGDTFNTSAYCFRYDEMDISLSIKEDEDVFNEQQEYEKPVAGRGNLPF